MANIILFTDVTTQSITYGNQDFEFEFTQYAAGAYAIASHLRRQGFSVLVVPHCLKLSLAGVQHLIKRNNKDLLWVGYSTTLTSSSGQNMEEYRRQWATTDQLTVDVPVLFNLSIPVSFEPMWGIEQANLIAQQLDVPVLIGGASVTRFGHQQFAACAANVHIITGNAERSVEHISQLLKQDPQAQLPKSIDNTDYDNVEFKTVGFDFVAVDAIAPTDWLPIEISRGCAFNCAYCSYDRKSLKDTHKYTSTLRDEMIRNYELYGVTRYRLMDDLYNDSKEKVRVLYDEVWSKLPFKPEWTSYMRLDLIWSDPESAEFLLNSGARIGSFGIETLHNVAGRRVGKGLGRTRILETLEHLKSVWNNQVLVNGLFIAGLPHEPEDSIVETIEWLKTTDLVHSWLFSPLGIGPSDMPNATANDITLDNTKYGITWLKPGIWQNQQGLTSIKAKQLARRGFESNKSIVRTAAEYAEWRSLGYSHQDIVDFVTNPNLAAIIHQGCVDLKQKVDQKVNNFLALAEK